MANGGGLRRTSQQLLRRSAELRNEVRESTDANLLASLRILGLIYGPLDRQARIDHAFQKARAYRLAAHAGWRHALGGITYFLLMVLVVTGVLMAFYYRPSVQEAYPSIQHMVSSVPFGWLVRDMHAWAASLVVIFAVIHFARVFLEAAYKSPRETNWTMGVLLLVVVLLFGASGYLLPWEQTGYWTTAEALDTVARVPIFGGLIAELLQGDEVVSGATLSRFFALHVIILPWVLLGLISLHFGLVRKHGIAPLAYGSGHGREVRFYPHHLMRILGTAAVTVAVLFTLAVLIPRDFGPQADPGTPPDALAGTWVAVAPWRALVHYLGPWGPVLLVLAGVALLLLPLLDRGFEVDIRRRPPALIMGAVLLAGLVGTYVAGQLLEDEGPSHRHAEAAAAPLGGTTGAEALPAPPATETDADSVTAGGQP